jgi:hypothetical protein
MKKIVFAAIAFCVMTVSKESFVVSRNNVARCDRDVTAWLRRLGMVR